MGKVITIGNEKGGSGKSTLSMHLAAAYLYAGKKVATIDLDGRQGTLTHYLENRIRYIDERKLALPVPEHLVVTPPALATKRGTDDDQAQLESEIKALKSEYDIVIIDTPGTFSHLSNTGHRNADILMTPVNDSLVDLDVLANLDPATHEILRPSQYAENVKAIEQTRRAEGREPLKWLVLRNRISHIDARNKRDVDQILGRLAETLGFKYISGIGERVVYREMFLKGLTILDLMKLGTEEISISHIAAKNEISLILNEIGMSI
ncbi:MAG: division plane positioning ATPase MipZ [Rickettsiales bacterium]|jgi:chromosome partitioning protein|nr:division plane positioning ATPase MipZ [Rickettsiales bacterium]